LLGSGASVLGLYPELSWRAWQALGRACRQMTAAEALLEVEELLEGAVKARTLFIWGSDDQVHPAAAARATALDLGRPDFVEIAGGSHRVHEEQPALVAETIEELLGR
jgi:pimeloyl-ACP methyl ester carboxylesterase